MSKAFKKSVKMSGIPFSRDEFFICFKIENAKGEGIHCFFINSIKNKQL